MNEATLSRVNLRVLYPEIVINQGISLFYQDDFLTPGISPLLAISLKQILHKPKSFINPLYLPHLKHLLTILEENFGFLFDLLINDFLAIKIKIF